MVMNHSKEYWYMGSMLERSVVQKKRSCVRLATGIYLLRVWSISNSVFSASATFACTSTNHIDSTIYSKHTLWPLGISSVYPSAELRLGLGLGLGFNTYPSRFEYFITGHLISIVWLHVAVAIATHLAQKSRSL